MLRKKKGLYWHVYHDELVSFCYDYELRVQNIKGNKPTYEIEERVRVLQKVKGKLPDDVLKVGAAYIKAINATAAYDKSGKSWAAYSKSGKSWATYSKSWAASDKVSAAYYKVLEDNREVIEKLHAKECKDCSWNGKRLTFKRKGRNDQRN